MLASWVVLVSWVVLAGWVVLVSWVVLAGWVVSSHALCSLSHSLTPWPWLSAYCTLSWWQQLSSRWQSRTHIWTGKESLHCSEQRSYSSPMDYPLSVCLSHTLELLLSAVCLSLAVCVCEMIDLIIQKVIPVTLIVVPLCPVWTDFVHRPSLSCNTEYSVHQCIGHSQIFLQNMSPKEIYFIYLVVYCFIFAGDLNIWHLFNLEWKKRWILIEESASQITVCWWRTQ